MNTADATSDLTTRKAASAYNINIRANPSMSFTEAEPRSVNMQDASNSTCISTSVNVSSDNVNLENETNKVSCQQNEMNKELGLQNDVNNKDPNLPYKRKPKEDPNVAYKRKAKDCISRIQAQERHLRRISHQPTGSLISPSIMETRNRSLSVDERNHPTCTDEGCVCNIVADSTNRIVI